LGDWGIKIGFLDEIGLLKSQVSLNCPDEKSRRDFGIMSRFWHHVAILASHRDLAWQNDIFKTSRNRVAIDQNHVAILGEIL